MKLVFVRQKRPVNVFLLSTFERVVPLVPSRQNPENFVKVHICETKQSVVKAKYVRKSGWRLIRFRNLKIIVIIYREGGGFLQIMLIYKKDDDFSLLNSNTLHLQPKLFYLSLHSVLR